MIIYKFILSRLLQFPTSIYISMTDDMIGEGEFDGYESWGRWLYDR